ncbi:hypothetical protein [Thalassobaculum sp.]|uniref:hypothetical protein n=1 Tax=Thalassobaculum sp. TaxID=2022740 RepID=UPI0032EBCE0C
MPGSTDDRDVPHDAGNFRLSAQGYQVLLKVHIQALNAPCAQLKLNTILFG